MKKLLLLIRFWIVDVPLWIPKRLYWNLKRRNCIKNGCNSEILKDEETKRIEFLYCKRCGAYKGKKEDNSEYPLIEVNND